MQRVSNIFRGATFCFWNCTKAIGSHACSSIYEHSNTVSTVYIFLSKVFVKKSKNPVALPHKLMQHTVEVIP